MADTGEVLSNGSVGSTKYPKSGIKDNFRPGQGNSRARKRVDRREESNDFGLGGSVDSLKGPSNGKREAPFGGGSKQGNRGRFNANEGFNNDYYASNQNA